MAKFSEIIKSNEKVLVDFHATWCGPCKTLAPILVNVKSKFEDELKIVKIDVDKNGSIAQSYKVQGVPTLILFKNGKQVWRQSGVVPASEIERIVKEA